MEQPAETSTYIFVTACVFVMPLVVYLRCVQEVRKARRAYPVNVELPEEWAQAGEVIKQALWVIAPVLGLACTWTAGGPGTAR